MDELTKSFFVTTDKLTILNLGFYSQAPITLVGYNADLIFVSDDYFNKYESDKLTRNQIYHEIIEPCAKAKKGKIYYEGKLVFNG